LNDVVLTFESATSTSDKIIQDIPFDLAILCPAISTENLQQQLGVDPKDVVNFLENDYAGIQQSARENIMSFKNTLGNLEDSLDNVDSILNSIKNILWVLPFWVTFNLVWTGIALAGLVSMWTGRSDRRVQKVMDIGVLPLLIIWIILGWLLCIVFSLGTVVSTDVCTAGPDPGSPDYLVGQILASQNFDPSDPTYKLITAYTGGCRGEDPLAEVYSLRDAVQENLSTIKYRLEQAEAVGYVVMKFKCGDGNQIDKFFRGITLVEDELKSVQVALDVAISTLSCPRVNRLYASLIHDSLCTKTATGLASGFILLFIITICTMVLVSLRAAWRSPKVLKRKDTGEKVFDENGELHDEISEVSNDYD